MDPSPLFKHLDLAVVFLIGGAVALALYNRAGQPFKPVTFGTGR